MSLSVDTITRRPLPMLQEGKVNVIMDAQWGSTGKGKLAGWLCANETVDLCICDFMPNAGHTYVNDEDKSWVFTQLPVGAAFGIPCLLGPHCAINKENFFREIDSVDRPDVKIHAMAVVIVGEDREREQEVAGYIANTAKGGYSATVEKMLRSGRARLAMHDEQLAPFIANTANIAQHAVRRKGVVLAETAQGFDLGLHYGWSYPYVAGRDCLLGRVLDNAGVSPRHLGSVIASIRTYPIRVGHTEKGHSGPYYPDQTELTWESLSMYAGTEIKPEITTVTKRVRRVFSFSWTQIERMCDFLEPDFAFLNFANYLPMGHADPFVHSLHAKLLSRGCELSLVGTGAKLSEMVRL